MRRDRVVCVDVEGIMVWFPAGASILPVSESGKTVFSTNGQEKDRGSNPGNDKWFFCILPSVETGSRTFPYSYLNIPSVFFSWVKASRAGHSKFILRFTILINPNNTSNYQSTNETHYTQQNTRIITHKRSQLLTLWRLTTHIGVVPHR